MEPGDHPHVSVQRRLLADHDAAAEISAESAPAAHSCAIAEALVGRCSPVSDKAVSKDVDR